MDVFSFADSFHFLLGNSREFHGRWMFPSSQDLVLFLKLNLIFISLKYVTFARSHLVLLAGQRDSERGGCCAGYLVQGAHHGARVVATSGRLHQAAGTEAGRERRGSTARASATHVCQTERKLA
eukprot:3511662-Pleurochrysis_carterae.AAC.2